MVHTYLLYITGGQKVLGLNGSQIRLRARAIQFHEGDVGHAALDTDFTARLLVEAVLGSHAEIAQV